LRWDALAGEGSVLCLFASWDFFAGINVPLERCTDFGIRSRLLSSTECSHRNAVSVNRKCFLMVLDAVSNSTERGRRFAVRRGQVCRADNERRKFDVEPSLDGCDASRRMTQTPGFTGGRRPNAIACPSVAAAPIYPHPTASTANPASRVHVKWFKRFFFLVLTLAFNG